VHYRETVVDNGEVQGRVTIIDKFDDDEGDESFEDEDPMMVVIKGKAEQLSLTWATTVAKVVVTRRRPRWCW
jgi:hypothetical protein